MAESIRQRGRDSWQLRVHRGVDGTGRPRWVTTTIHGGRHYAEARLAEQVAEVGHARLRSGSVGELLEHWFAAASPNWARVPPAEVHPPNPAQVAHLLAFVLERSPALFVFLRLAVSTGARRSQLLALRWRDVDFDHGALAFTRAAVAGPNGVELRPTKTHRTYRVDIDHDTLAVLVEHRTARAGTSGGAPGSNAFVFSAAADGSKP